MNISSLPPQTPFCIRWLFWFAYAILTIVTHDAATANKANQTADLPPKINARKANGIDIAPLISDHHPPTSGTMISAHCLIFDTVLDGLSMRLARQPFQHLTTLRFWRLISGVHSILLVIKRPIKTGQASVDSIALSKWWKALERFDNDAETSKGVERLNTGTFLIRADVGLLFLADGIRLAHENSLEYKVLFFEKSPEFSTLPNETKPSQITP